MLEQWEISNYQPEYKFVVRQYAIGKGHSVNVLWRGGEVDSVFGFASEYDASGSRQSRKAGCWRTKVKLPNETVSPL